MDLGVLYISQEGNMRFHFEPNAGCAAPSGTPLVEKILRFAGTPTPLNWDIETMGGRVVASNLDAVLAAIEVREEEEA